jgi:DNA-binding transcriptional ArsR family regulator
MPRQQLEAINLFFCYAHEDEKLQSELSGHLSSLRRQGLIKDWKHFDIKAGQDKRKEVATYLKNAHIILLLISPDFMKSDYYQGFEMKRAMERHNKGEAKVIPNLFLLKPHLDPHRYSNRERRQIRNTHIKSTQSQFLCMCTRIAIQSHTGTPRAQLHDLQFTPGDTMHACSQGFADGFLGSETARYFERLATTLLDLRFSKDALQEAVAVVGEDATNTRDLDDVDANSNIDALCRKQGSRKIDRRTEEVCSKRHAWLAHQRCKEQWPIFIHYFSSSNASAGC